MWSIAPTPEQTLLDEAATRYLRDRGDDAARWHDFATMGWLGLPFPEAFGGTGGGMAEVLVLARAFGRSLATEPYLSSVVLGGLAVLRGGNAIQHARILPPLAAGTLRLALGFAEPQSGYDPCDVATRATTTAEGAFRLDGHKAVVLGAPSADHIIVTARGDAGLSLFLLDASRAGISRRDYATIDGRDGAEVLLDGVLATRGDLLGAEGQGAPLLEHVLQAGTVAAAGEMVGAMEGAIAQTVSYLNTRETFGRKLASYQALRHRLADMVVLKEEAAALAELAARAFDQATGAERSAAIAAAKAYAGEAGRKVAEEAVQMHGAVAIADECVVGHYLKRVAALDRMFGDVDVHLDIFGRSARSLN